MKYLSFLGLLLVMCSCVPEEGEKSHRKNFRPPLIISDDGGEQYVKEMMQEINARKSTRYLEQDPDYALHMYFEEFEIVVDSLNCSDKEWRIRHLDVINKIYHIGQLSDLQEPIRLKLAKRFIAHPNEVIEQINSFPDVDFEHWNTELSTSIKAILSPEDIQINQLIEIMKTNCIDCDSTALETVEIYVNYLSKL